MRGGRVAATVVAAFAVLTLAGCASSASPAGGSSGLDLPNVGSSTTLTAHSVDGVTVSLPASWDAASPAGTSLQLTDSGGGATVTVIVQAAGGDASSYLETQLPDVLQKVMGISVTESLKGHTRALDVTGSDDAARLETTGARADEPVDCTAVAARTGSDLALLVGTDVEPRLWEQIVASLQIGTLQPT